MTKTLRIALVLLLAALLPIRGAMAAAMLCPQGSHGAAAAHRMVMPAAGHDHAAMLKEQQHVHDAAGAASDDGHAGGCSLCAAFCTMTPMPSAAPAVHAATLVRALAFPVLAAPAPVFQSDGPERPPRTL
ncbi:MAG TPA: hypothetical protein VNU71_11990 [Burkholderiaceae bacterium]|nr:hypothetical protein [Burkholderiaceae bacterium]